MNVGRVPSGSSSSLMNAVRRALQAKRAGEMSVSGAAHAPTVRYLETAFVPKHFVPRLSAMDTSGRVANIGAGRVGRVGGMV